MTHPAQGEREVPEPAYYRLFGVTPGTTTMLNFPVASFIGNRPIEINIEISKQVIETVITSAINEYFDRMEQKPAATIGQTPSPDLVDRVINLAKQVQGDNDALSAMLGAKGDDPPSA